MTRKPTILVKFLVLLFVIFTVLSIFLIVVSNIIIRNSFIDRSKLAVSSAIQYESKDLGPQDFSLKDPKHAQAVFSSLYNKVKSTEIIRIKVWDYSAKVIFSDDKSIVGQRFADNEPFKEALLKNQAVSEIGKADKSENASEVGYKQLLEVYVPITFEGESVPSGVVEAYFKLDDVNIRIHDTQAVIFTTILIFTVTSFGILLLVFNKIIYKQVDKIHLQAVALEAAANGVVITDIDGTIQWVNPAFSKLTGYSSKEAVGNSTRMLNSGKHDKAFYENLWNTIKSGQEWHGVMIDRKKDGSVYTEEQTITPVKNEHGKIIAFIAIKQDVTQKKELDEQLKARNQDLERLTKEQENSKQAMLNVLEDLESTHATLQLDKAKDEAMLASIGEGLVAVDNQRKVIIINNAATKMLGWETQDLIGKIITELRLEDEAGNLIPLDKRPTTIALATGEATRVTYYFVRQDKSRFPMAITATPIKLNGKTVGLVELIRDVSQENAIDKAKTEFVSLASHQLRTPLSAVSWYSEMLLAGDAGKLNDEQKKYMDEVHNANQHMVDMVNDFLNVSRMELGTFIEAPRPTDVIELAKSVIDEEKPQIDAKKIDFSTGFGENIPALQVDPELLRLATQNLLSNAVKYTPDGGKINLAIRLVKSGELVDNQQLSRDSLVVTVSDTGLGIPRDVQDKIFTKLFRADNVREKSTEGTGLGLYIVKLIVEHSNGKVWFTSEENKGSTFYVVLPLGEIKKAGETLVPK